MRSSYLVALVFLLFTIFSTPAQGQAASNGSLVKSTSNSAVYYLVDGQRYAFPNEKVFLSWYTDFSSVLTIPASELASYHLAGNVTYRPGKLLVKIQTDPKVYAVSRYGVLRWITSEQIATTLYGNTWNTQVHDIADTFFTNYQLGQPITQASDYPLTTELAITRIAQNIPGVSVTASASVATISGCQVFPAEHAWNQDISSAPLHPNSTTYMSSIGLTSHLHADFGEDQSYGIPYNVVPGTQPNVPITFTAYGDESDPGPYPIPANAKIEDGSDAHVLVLDQDHCKLYELYAASKNTNDAGWSAESGAVWDLKTGALRKQGWTSADAAGLPILPGLIRADEVLAGEVNHAIRFTAQHTQNGYILPATHEAGSNNASYPPMGLRIRMKATYDISQLTGQAKIIATAMKKYGMILADNGSNLFFGGATDPRWKDDELNELKSIPGSAFEAVDTGPILQ